MAVSIDETFQKKIDMLDAHVSQVYEWLPWHAGRLDDVPKDAAARRAWLATQRGGRISERRPGGAGEALRGGGAARRCSTPKRSSCASTAAGRTRPSCRGLFPFLPDAYAEHARYDRFVHRL